MRRLMIVLTMMIAGAAGMSAQPQGAEAAVRKAIEDHYFKAHATGSGESLKGMFIDEGRMMWVQDGQLRTRTSADYIGGFSGKPAADEAKRKRRILMVDVTGDAAVAKVELDNPGARLIDYFTLLRLGGEWKIVHKSFVRMPQ